MVNGKSTSNKPDCIEIQVEITALINSNFSLNEQLKTFIKNKKGQHLAASTLHNLNQLNLFYLFL